MSMNADYVSPYNSSYVTINRVRWPEYGWEVTNKDYVDDKLIVSYINPLHKNVLRQLYIDEAGAGAAGVVSTGSQYFTGEKTFSSNAYGQHFTESYTKVSTLATPLTASSPAMINYSGAGETCTLPLLSTLSPGFSYIFWNSGTTDLRVVQQGADPALSATVGSGSYAEFKSRGTAWDYIPFHTASQTSISWNVGLGGVVVMITGSCSTTDSTTAVSLFDYNAAAIGSANAMSVEYNIVCVASTGSYGQFTGLFKAFCSTGPSPAVTITTPFTTAVSSLDAGVNQCALSATGGVTAGHVTIRVTGQGLAQVKWTGTATITQRAM